MFIACSNFAQVAKDQVLMINVNSSESDITLNWSHAEGFTGSYNIMKRPDGDVNWTDMGTINAPNVSFKDDDIEVGKGYEYSVTKILAGQAVALGYIYAGVEKEGFVTRGGAILLIDSTFMESLGEELDRFTLDLENEGWTTTTIYAGRNEAVTTVKERIVSAANEFTESLIIIGHVPVPYSGNFTRFSIPPPDGHIEGSGNHTGAWAADAYYGDLVGNWTDNTVNHTDAKLDRGDNIPGDGKFDQTKLPNEITLQIGRIDFWDMPAFGKTEEELLKSYLDRNHAYRIGEWQVRERALIDNNFTGFNLASSGYHNFSTFMPVDSIDDAADYVTAQRAGSYLWSYGCGAGSFTSCNGLNNGRASTADIAAEPLQNVFTMVAGSYFGDWDVKDNFLRAPICNQALVSFWAGLPKWYVHHMGLGLNVGYGARLSMNNQSEYFNGQFNSSENSIHIALMGDPTLCLKGIGTPANLSAVSKSGNVELTWDAANGEIVGYNIYVVNENNVYEKVNAEVVTGTSYTDENNFFTGDYMYSVRAVKLETTPSGTYYNVGGGPKAEVSHINSLNENNRIEFAIFPNPASSLLNIKLTSNDLCNLEILSLDGKVIMTIDKEENSFIDISSLEKGVYFIAVTNESGARRVKQFVKM